MDIDKRLLAGFIVILILVFAAGVKYAEFRQSRLAQADSLQLNMDAIINDADEPEKNEEDPKIKAYITGAVERPGVYSFTAGARIYEALELAGPLGNAELKYVEMARIIADEETIYIPAAGETEADPGLRFSAYSPDGRGQLNINRATADEMAAELDGIGGVLAQRIVDYRNDNGPFKTIEEIKNVSGIGDKRYAGIKDNIAVK